MSEIAARTNMLPFVTRRVFGSCDFALDLAAASLSSWSVSTAQSHYCDAGMAAVKRNASMLRSLTMSLGRPASPMRQRVFQILLGGHICTAALGCTVYSELESLRPPEPDSGTRTDGGSRPDGAPSDRATPPSDGAGGDTGGRTDTPSLDVARDAAADAGVPPIPPADATPPDTSSDPSIGTDVTIVDVKVDVAMPESSTPDVTIDRAVDNYVPPPPPDTGPDLTVPDVVDVGTRVDADATAPPPPDADGGPGPIDVRDSGPTCWGTPSTNDEDGDGIVDECDNCPSISNANQADVREVNAGETADGVGDACDPRPTAEGESIFLFDGLNFTSLPPEWTNIGVGNWTATGNSVRPNGTELGQELARSFPSSLSNYLAETAFTFNALETNGSSSLPFRMDNANNGWRCVVGTPDGIQGQFFMGKVTAGTSEPTPPQITTIGVPQPGDRYRVLGGAFNGSIYCMLGTGQRQNRSDTSTSGESGFRSTGTSATFEYLLVYRLGGTIPP